MKSFVSILFISFFIWNYIGFFTYFQIEKHAAQKEIKRKLKLSVPKDELRIFMFTLEESKQLIWHKAHEFEYQNRMYDIVYSDTNELGDMRYTCISDLQETVLFEKLGEYVAQDLTSNKHKPLNKLKLNIEQPIIILEKYSDYSSVFDCTEKDKSYGFYFYSLKLSELRKNTPPPQKLSC